MTALQNMSFRTSASDVLAYVGLLTVIVVGGTSVLGLFYPSSGYPTLQILAFTTFGMHGPRLWSRRSVAVSAEGIAGPGGTLLRWSDIRRVKPYFRKSPLEFWTVTRDAWAAVEIPRSIVYDARFRALVASHAPADNVLLAHLEKADA